MNSVYVQISVQEKVAMQSMKSEAAVLMSRARTLVRAE